MIFNTAFKKKFQFSVDTMTKRAKTINILIPVDEQKNHHQSLIEKYSEFDEGIHEVEAHAQYQCFLKINPENDNVSLLQPYQV